MEIRTPMITMSGTSMSMTFLNMKSFTVSAHPSAEVISGASRLFLIGEIALSIAISNLSAVTTCMYPLRTLLVIVFSAVKYALSLLSRQVICLVPNDCVKMSLRVIGIFCGTIGLATNCVIAFDL